jgi:hypothetical protein
MPPGWRENGIWAMIPKNTCQPIVTLMPGWVCLIPMILKTLRANGRVAGHVSGYDNRRKSGEQGFDDGLYGDVIETIDWSVGQVLKTLKQEGLIG